MLSYDIFNYILDNLHPGEIIRLLFVLKSKSLIDTIDWNYLNKKNNYIEEQNKGFNKFINGRKKDIELVKQDGYALKFIIEQDTEICIKAVKRNGGALVYVKKQDREMCIELVKHDGYVLRYVKEQDKEICMEAVKQFGYALYWVKEQDTEICMEAIKQSGYALDFVKEQYKKRV
jgi:hypothetical protein